LQVDAVDCFGLGGGLGFSYSARPAPLLLGYGCLDPMEELAIAVGAWVDQKHSTCRDAAIQEMRDHLTRENTPVIVPLRLAGDCEVEIDATAASRTFASVTELGEASVVYRVGSSDTLRKLSFATWLERLDEPRRWAVVISNGRFTAVRTRVRGALRRGVHRMTAGWRNRLGGTAALAAFLSGLSSSSKIDHQPTLAASAQLGGGLGRALFAAFLERHAEHLPADLVRLAAHFRELDAEWRRLEAILAEDLRPGAFLLKQIEDGEIEGAVRMREHLG
jgi:hypothetical protein